MRERAVYLTPEGYARLAEERRLLVEERRAEVAARLRAAREAADVMDDSDYDEALRAQEQVEQRIRELERLLVHATIIEEATGRGYVTVGSRVEVRGPDGAIERYEIVGKAEADPRRGRVSNESPVGRALLGRRRGDRCTVVAPAGSFTLEIVAIE